MGGRPGSARCCVTPRSAQLDSSAREADDAPVMTARVLRDRALAVLLGIGLASVAFSVWHFCRPVGFVCYGSP